MKGQEGRRLRSVRRTPPTAVRLPWPPISRLLRVLFLSFFEIFFPCVNFLLFFKIRRKKVPSKWAFYKKYEFLFFPVLPTRVGETRPLSGGPINPALFPVPCPVSRVASVAPCLRLTMLHCLHAPEADVCQGLGVRSCAAAAHPPAL